MERGPHHKTWERIEYEPSPDGKVVERRHRYQELATGMHFRNEQGEWEDSQEQIEILPNSGGAVASKGPHKVIFPVEIKSGLIELQAPDGQWLRSRVWGLAYSDSSTGESVLLANLQESDGEVIGDNIVVYRRAFGGLGDLRYTYTRAGFEQDVVMRMNPPKPESLGLSSKFTRLQVLTEFVEAPVPARNLHKTGELSELGFGEMNIGFGKAFSLDGKGRQGEDIPISKAWEQIESRDFLIEEVEYETVDDELQALPALPEFEGAAMPRKGKGNNVMTALSDFLPPRYAKTETMEALTKPKQMARASYNPSPSLVLDYVSITSSLTNYTFRGDMTYHLSGAVVLYGTNIMEGNTVLKYSAGSYLQVRGNLLWETDVYRPAVFTAKDDNFAGGEIISGSTGNPVGTYATYALQFPTPSSPVEVKHAFVRHAGYGVLISGGGAQTHRIRHCQFRNVNTAVYANSTTAELENLLVYRANGGAIAGPSSTMRGSHLTLHQVASVIPAVSSVHLTNSLFVWVTNWPAAFTSFNNATNNDSATFQTVGGSMHYLSTGSPYRDRGTWNISQTLLNDLKKLTTYPPVAYTNVSFNSDLTFSPQAQRDHDVPDLGYHLSPLDYSFGGCDAYADITFSPGTAVGWFRTTSGWQHAGHGIHVGDNRILTFTGNAENPCYWVRLNTVQENDRSGGYGPGGISSWGDGREFASKVRMRFTRCSMMGPEGNHMRDDYGTLDVAAKDCEFYGGGIGTYISDYAMTNCLFYRTDFLLDGGNTNYNRFYTFQNCTFYGGRLYINRWSSTPSQVRVTVLDTAFDGSTVTTTGQHNYDPALTTYNYNAFRSGFNRTAPQGANDVVVTSFDWQAGSHGPLYLPSGSPLINAGSYFNAAAVGLYHHTTQADQTKEGTSRIDFGFHYIAADQNGLRFDSDGDGWPDYIEDANGNGLCDGNETDRGVYDSPNGLSSGNVIQVFTPLK